MPPQDPNNPYGAPAPAQPMMPAQPMAPQPAPMPQPVAAPAPQPVITPLGQQQPAPVYDPTPMPPQPVVSAPAPAQPAPQPLVMPAVPQPMAGPAPQMMPAPAMGGMGGMVAPQPMAGAAMGYNTAAGSNGKMKLALFGGIGLAVVAAIVAGVLIVPGLFGAVKYSKGDLVEYKTSTYTAAAPRQWEDVSDNKEVQKSLGLSGLGADKDTKVYAYKYDASKNAFRSAVLTASFKTGATDAEIKQMMSSSMRAEIEKGMKDSAKDFKDPDCSSVTAGDPSVSTDDSNFAVKMTGSFTCTLTADAKKKAGVDSVHYEYLIGMKNEKGLELMIKTSDADWKRNQNFYTDQMITSFKAL